MNAGKEELLHEGLRHISGHVPGPKRHIRRELVPANPEYSSQAVIWAEVAFREYRRKRFWFNAIQIPFWTVMTIPFAIGGPAGWFVALIAFFALDVVAPHPGSHPFERPNVIKHVDALEGDRYRRHHERQRYADKKTDLPPRPQYWVAPPGTHPEDVAMMAKEAGRASRIREGLE